MRIIGIGKKKDPPIQWVGTSFYLLDIGHTTCIMTMQLQKGADDNNLVQNDVGLYIL